MSPDHVLIDHPVLCTEGKWMRTHRCWFTDITADAVLSMSGSHSSCSASLLLLLLMLQVFYGILVQHFVMLAGDQPTPVSHLDVLTRVILQLTPEVPFYAATVARTRIEKLHDRLAAHLADPLAAGPLMGWPGARQLLQLRLFSCLFPTSDKRHPVTTPLALLMGKYLMQCPVTNPFQAAVGLLLAGMALHNTAAAARFCPEVVSYLSATLQGFMPVAAAVAKAGASAAATVSDARLHLFSPGVLALDCCRISKKQRAGSKSQRKQQAEVWEQQQQQLPSLKLYQLLSSAADSAEFQTDEFKLQVLGCAVSTATRVCQLSSGCGDAAPEVLQPLHTAAAAVAGLQGLPVAAASAVSQLQQQLQETSAAVVVARLPMVQSHRYVADLASWPLSTALPQRVVCSTEQSVSRT